MFYKDAKTSKVKLSLSQKELHSQKKILKILVTFAYRYETFLTWYFRIFDIFDTTTEITYSNNFFTVLTL